MAQPPEDALSQSLPHSARGWWRSEFRSEGAPSTEILAELFDLEPEGLWRHARGRETFAWPGRDDLVVKRFQGGEARDWWYERLREGEQPRSPARREAENLLALEREGLRVPRAMAWVEEHSARRHPGLAGAEGRSALVMGRLVFNQNLRQALAKADPGGRERLGRELLDLVARLHAGGWYHRDLYLEHVVLLAEGGLGLLDLGRARRERSPRERWFIKDLAALYSSVPGAVPVRARLRFLSAWLRRRRVQTPSLRRRKRELRRWSRVIQSKARRMAQHAPRVADAEGSARAAEQQGLSQGSSLAPGESQA